MGGGGRISSVECGRGILQSHKLMGGGFYYYFFFLLVKQCVPFSLPKKKNSSSNLIYD